MIVTCHAFPLFNYPLRWEYLIEWSEDEIKILADIARLGISITAISGRNLSLQMCCFMLSFKTISF